MAINIPETSIPSVSTSNSSVVALTSGSTLTGTWEECLAYEDISIAVKTDQNGTYTIQFSPDGTNADTTLTRYYKTNQIEPPHVFEVTRKYFRITFTNTSASNQTYFRLQTILGNRGQLNIPADSVMAQDYDSISTRPTKYEYEVALGLRQGQTTWNKFGYNSDLDVGTEVIASFGGTFAPLTTANTISIVSSSASDTNAGVGANTVSVTYIDANKVSQTETIVLNGTTPVLTSGTALGINRIQTTLSGTSLSNVGTITATIGGSTQGQVPIGEGFTQQAIFFVQDGHTFLADFLSINAEKTGGGASPKVRIKGWVFNYDTNTKYMIFNKLIDTSAENNDSIIPSQPFVVNENSCLWFEGTTDQSDTFVSVRFSGIEVRKIGE
jgi:hypothetical protein